MPELNKINSDKTSQSRRGEARWSLTGRWLIVLLASTFVAVVLGANPLALNVAVSSGLLTGSFTPAVGGRAIPFKGLLLQTEDAGYGLFQVTTGQTGWLTLTPVSR